MVYIVKKAIYLHDVYGPYATRAAAKVAFNSAYRKMEKSGIDHRFHNDFDGHHKYYIVRELPKIGGSKSIKTMEYEEIKYTPLTED